MSKKLTLEQKKQETARLATEVVQPAIMGIPKQKFTTHSLKALCMRELRDISLNQLHFCLDYLTAEGWLTVALVDENKIPVQWNRED